MLLPGKSMRVYQQPLARRRSLAEGRHAGVASSSVGEKTLHPPAQHLQWRWKYSKLEGRPYDNTHAHTHGWLSNSQRKSPSDTYTAPYWLDLQIQLQYIPTKMTLNYILFNFYSQTNHFINLTHSQLFKTFSTMSPPNIHQLA